MGYRTLANNYTIPDKRAIIKGMKKKLILTCAVVLFLALVILLVFKIKQKEVIPQKSNIDQINQVDQEPLIINNLALSNFPETKWLSYQNNDLGITFNYPDQVIPNMYWTSYDAVGQVLRSNSVLAKNNILYIKSGEYSFDSVEAEYQKYKEENGGNFGLDPSWRITIKDINNEQELSNFIKQYYGKACSYHKVATAFPDTFDIILDGDGKSLDVTECPVNYDYYLKYSPINKKIVSWNTSQECQMGYGFEKCFDKQIAESFHFIKQTDLKICPFEVAGFKFSYPKTWGDCKVDGQKISFRTDFKKYNVDLVAEIRETSKEMADQGFITYNIKQEKIEGINNSIVYRVACGGGIACSALNINNQKFYEINWDVFSNQPVPNNLEWIWTPDYSFTPDDIWNILRSIQ